MKTKHLISTGLILALTVLISSQASARMWGQNHGPMMGGPGMMWGQNYGPMMGGPRMMYDNAQTLTEAQRDQVTKIEEKYHPQLAEKETAVRNKAAEIPTAQAKDSTTIGELDNLRNELYGLEQDYWTLRDKVNQEISSTIGTGYYGNMGWGPGYCAWHDDHPGMYGNTDTAPRVYSQRGPMMGYGRSWCRW